MLKREENILQWSILTVATIKYKKKTWAQVVVSNLMCFPDCSPPAISTWHCINAGHLSLLEWPFKWRLEIKWIIYFWINKPGKCKHFLHLNFGRLQHNFGLHTCTCKRLHVSRANKDSIKLAIYSLWCAFWLHVGSSFYELVYTLLEIR